MKKKTKGHYHVFGRSLDGKYDKCFGCGEVRYNPLIVEERHGNGFFLRVTVLKNGSVMLDNERIAYKEDCENFLFSDQDIANLIKMV